MAREHDPDDPHATETKASKQDSDRIFAVGSCGRFVSKRGRGGEEGGRRRRATSGGGDMVTRRTTTSGDTSDDTSDDTSG